MVARRVKYVGFGFGRRQRRCHRLNTLRPPTSYGGALATFEKTDLSAARRVSRISARKLARAQTKNQLRACDTRSAHLIRAVAA
jgi:hypothetical protein